MFGSIVSIIPNVGNIAVKSPLKTLCTKRNTVLNAERSSKPKAMPIQQMETDKRNAIQLRREYGPWGQTAIVSVS